MKALDEVIKALEENGEIDLGCVNCVYADGCGDDSLYDDALFYLKEYKKDRENPDGDHQQLKKAQKLLWEFYQNDPLTWDELKTMEGKPVWYEHEFWKGWIILGKVEQGVNCEMIPDREERWYIVKDGSAKAYRKERN